jgi:hypothetical protein
MNVVDGKMRDGLGRVLKPAHKRFPEYTPCPYNEILAAEAVGPQTFPVVVHMAPLGNVQIALAKLGLVVTRTYPERRLCRLEPDHLELVHVPYQQRFR